jgi:hypothetical protein
LTVLTLVQDQLADKTAKQLSDRSHKEEGFRKTQNGELISYSFAGTLDL